MSLPLCPRIFRISVTVQPTFITDAYRVSIVAPHMRPHFAYRTGSQDSSVTPHIEMIPRSVEPYKPVRSLQRLFGQRIVLARGATMDYYQVNRSHLLIVHRIRTKHTQHSRSHCNYHFQNRIPKTFTFSHTSFFQFKIHHSKHLILIPTGSLPHRRHFRRRCRYRPMSCCRRTPARN